MPCNFYLLSVPPRNIIDVFVGETDNKWKLQRNTRSFNNIYSIFHINITGATSINFDDPILIYIFINNNWLIIK